MFTPKVIRQSRYRRGGEHLINISGGSIKPRCLSGKGCSLWSLCFVILSYLSKLHIGLAFQNSCHLFQNTIQFCGSRRVMLLRKRNRDDIGNDTTNSPDRHKIVTDLAAFKIAHQHSAAVLRSAVASQVIDRMAKVSVTEINDASQFACSRVNKCMLRSRVGMQSNN